MKWLKRLALVILSLLLALAAYSWWRFRDRHPAYHVALRYDADAASASLRVGFGQCPINPDLPDTWVDVNGDARYREQDGDYYIDGNGNGKFDAVWIAGFQNRRPASGLNDTLWARAVVFDDGAFRLGLCVIDAIGFGGDDIIEVRKAYQERLGIDYMIVSSTHSHQTPDLIGMWGPSQWKSGVSQTYLDTVRTGIGRAFEQACAALTEATVRYAQDLTQAKPLVEDTRPPTVLDEGLRILHITDRIEGYTLGSIVGWANHPETMWNKNLLLSSDFVHYLRHGVERGVSLKGEALAQGIGGTTVYVNGAIGGLMTTSPRMGIMALSGDTAYLEPSIAKARAQGELLAFLTLQMLQGDRVDTLANQSLRLRASTVELPLSNKLYWLAAIMGVLNRGMSSLGKIRSEIAYWQLGDIGFIHVPGEIYPELVNGGIEAPDGADYRVAPLELPPLRELVPVSRCFVVGLSNDMVGYIVPKSQWDQKAPYTYHQHDAPYGEINSLGPETAPRLHGAFVKLMRE